MLKQSPAPRAAVGGFGPFMLVEPLEDRRMLAVDIAVDLNSPLQTIRAIGTNVARNARNPDLNAPVRDATSNYLLQNFDIGMLRVAINLKTWEPVNDNADPNTIRAQGFPDTGGIKQNFQMIKDYAARGVKIVASVFDLPNWMVSNPEAQTKRELKPGFETELAEAISWWLNYAKQQYGVTIDTISINEGNGGYNARFNQLIFTNFLKIAGPYMANKGLGYVKWLAGDDGVNTLNAHAKPLLENPEIRQYLGPVAYHSWSYRFINDANLEQWYVQAQRYGKEVWVTEFGTDAEIMNVGTFATWERAQDTALAYWRALAVTRANAVLWWQFGTDFPLVDAQQRPNPTYYIVKPFHDNVKPGAVMVKSTPANSGAIKTLATKDIANNKFFMQILNGAGEGTSTQTLNLTGLPNQPLTFTRSSASAQGVSLGTFTPTNGRLSISSPAGSVITVSGTLGGGGTTPRPPVATISTPATTLQYTAGGTVSFSGNATDPDEGTLASSRFQWTVTPVRNGLFGNPQTFSGIKSGSFVVPADFQRAIDQKYVIQLTVTDATGLTSTKTVEIKPRIINITIKSNVAGVSPGLNGLWESLTTPLPMVAGVQNLFAPSPQLVGDPANGRIFKFSSWSIGGSATRTVTTTTDATYTANFTEVVDGSAGRFFGVSDDAFVRDGDGGDTNYGSDAVLQVKNSSDAGKTRYAYFRFDIGNAALTTAKLRLFANLSGNGEILPTNVFGVDANWDGNTITFNNRPLFGATPIATNVVRDQTGRWYEFDVSSYVKQARQAGATAVAFAVAQDGNSSPFVGITSNEAAANVPQLFLNNDTVTPPPPGPATEIGVSADAYVRDLRGNSNYGTGTELAVQSGATGVNNRGYLKFDISSIGNFTSVTLKLQGRLSEAVTNGLSVGIYNAADTWEENTLTWNNRPRESSTGLIGSVRVRDTTRRTYELDLTAYIQAQKAAGRQFVTLVLKNMTNTVGAQTVFAAREVTGSGARLSIS